MKKRKIFVTLIILLLVIVWVVIFNSMPEMNKIIISGADIPSEFEGFRVAQVSDLHNCELGEDNKRLFGLLEKADADIVAITGDFIDAFKTDTKIALDFAEKSVQIAPTYFVTGNHEAGVAEYESFKADLEAIGVRVLENEGVTLEKSGEKISLIGISDPAFLKENPVESVITELLDGNYTILLAHRPELFESYVKTGVDLVFTGHAHGGQFRIPFVGGVIAPGQGFFPKLDGGLYKKDNTQMIVSRGIGNSIIPFRINNRPEIVVAELKKIS